MLGLRQHIDQVLGLGGVSPREQRVGRARAVLTARTSDSVDVVLRVVGVVVVDDELDVVDVETSGSDVRGDEDGRGAVLELLQHPLALLLLLVAVDAHGGVAVAAHQTRELVGFPLGLGEDEDFVLGLAADFIEQFGEFLLLRKKKKDKKL